ncbi:MAG: thioredoxin domain-containing protein [Candidatus Omnitrophica bacterium]|nr:thioredoxin domain-containing protein [Candidatus Omnitrophota bacterium]
MKTNRLAQEKSPYLLQHAHNPVDWYPWGEEAWAKAKKEDKPIFLSIGYSTCHWCHVMERESFSDPATAAILNEHFVPIKVDREERPDVDALYMQAVIQMTGQGGWPLTVILTPELKPFYGGTYFPPDDRWGRPGLKSLLNGIAAAWRERRGELIHTGESLTQALQAAELARGAGSLPIDESLLAQAFELSRASFDETYGGFGSAPKFPQAHSLSFLLRFWKRSKDPRALEMVEKTLIEMRRGGMYDHLGGGFHRYSTDRQWRVPHFEKMLYDQAILARAYLEAYQATGRSAYAQIAREIFEYVLRDLTSPEGSFYCAEDADSAEEGEGEKKEGAFYLWTKAEIEKLLTPEQAKLFCAVYGIEARGNAINDPTGELQGKNVLFQVKPQEAPAQLDQAKAILLSARAQRPRPHLDDKVLTDWNGLMISALALGSRVLEEPHYAQAARKAADFILKRMVRKDGRLLHAFRQGPSGVPGTLEDYAFFVTGLVDLYEATFEPRYLTEAKRLTGEMVRLFWDEAKGGFFMTGSDAEQLLVRQKELYDGAIPSGNSVAALALLRVGRLTQDSGFEAKAKQLFETFSAELRQNPSAYTQSLIALDFALGPSKEIVIAGKEADPATQEMVRALYSTFLPNKVVALHPSGPAGQAIEALVPFLKEQVALAGKPTAYVCQNYTCDLPVTTADDLRGLLAQ